MQNFHEKRYMIYLKNWIFSFPALTFLDFLSVFQSAKQVREAKN